MFRKENLVWLYLVGIIIMMVVVFIAGRDYFLPIIRGERGTEIETGFIFNEPPEFTLDTSQDYRARITTTYGVVTVDLFENRAPVNVNNFVFLAGVGYYDGTYFHRLVPGFFIQGGDRNTLNNDPNDDGFGTPGYIVKDEINWDALKFDDTKRIELDAAGYQSAADVESTPFRKYSLAMASSGPDTNGGQFFIVFAEDADPRLAELDGRFTVIGEVILGKDVLARLASTDVDAQNPLIPRPIRELTVEHVEIIKI